MSQAIAAPSPLSRDWVTALVIQESTRAKYELGVSADYVADMVVKHQLTQDDIITVLNLRKECQAALRHINMFLQRGVDLACIRTAYHTREMMVSSLKREQGRLMHRLPNGTLLHDGVSITGVLEFLECYPEVMDANEADVWSIIEDAVSCVCETLDYVSTTSLALQILCSVARTHEVSCLDAAFAVLTGSLAHFVEKES